MVIEHETVIGRRIDHYVGHARAMPGERHLIECTLLLLVSQLIQLLGAAQLCSQSIWLRGEIGNWFLDSCFRV